MKKTRVVIALGGNALQKNGEATAEAQKMIAGEVCDTIAHLVDQYEIIIVHGNGPQVGNILIHEESAATDAAPAMPLETAVAMSQGQIGYWLSQALSNSFARLGKHQPVACLVTQVLVDSGDPAFQNPTKPIGQFYSATEAEELSSTRGWEMREDAGRGYRRVVPSPKPVDIIEHQEISQLVNSGVITIAAGGGGIPVIRSQENELQGIDAVIDKDLAAEKLAEVTEADILVAVTAVPQAYINYGQPDQAALGKITVAEVESHIQDNQFSAGSMLPKIQAIAKFAESGKVGIIAAPENLADALALRSGTIITNN